MMMFDVEADVQRALDSTRNMHEAAGIGIYMYVTAKEIVDFFNGLIYHVTDGSRKIRDGIALYAYLSVLSHFAMPFINLSLVNLFDQGALEKMTEEYLELNFKRIEDLKNDLLNLRSKLFHYHKVGNRLKYLGGTPECTCADFQEELM